jgi:hypothetical protein
LLGVRDMTNNTTINNELVIRNVLQYDAICVDFEDIEQEEWIDGYGNVYQRFFSLEDATVLKNGEWQNLKVKSPEWDELEEWVAENYPDHL